VFFYCMPTVDFKNLNRVVELRSKEHHKIFALDTSLGSGCTVFIVMFMCGLLNHGLVLCQGQCSY